MQIQCSLSLVRDLDKMGMVNPSDYSLTLALSSTDEVTLPMGLRGDGMPTSLRPGSAGSSSPAHRAITRVAHHIGVPLPRAHVIHTRQRWEHDATLAGRYYSGAISAAPSKAQHTSHIAPACHAWKVCTRRAESGMFE